MRPKHLHAIDLEQVPPWRSSVARAGRASAFWMVVLMIAWAPVASADRERFDEAEHWAFSTAVEVGIQGQTGKGNIDGSPIVGPRVPNPFPISDLGPNIVSPDASREEVLSALVGGNLEVMTPQLLSARGSGRPRLFLDLSVSAVFASEVGLARDSNPSIPFLPEGAAVRRGAEGAVNGRGNKITVQPQGPQIHAGIGTAFTLDLGSERLRIKPSFVYSRLRFDITGVAIRPIRIAEPADISSFRFFNVSEQTVEVYHGIGPALELEYETGERFGPFDITLFAKGHVSHLLGDLTTRFTRENPDQPDGAGEFVFFKYKHDTWTYRATTGVRFRWIPKSLR